MLSALAHIFLSTFGSPRIVLRMLTISVYCRASSGILSCIVSCCFFFDSSTSSCGIFALYFSFISHFSLFFYPLLLPLIYYFHLLFQRFFKHIHRKHLRIRQELHRNLINIPIITTIQRSQNSIDKHGILPKKHEISRQDNMLHKYKYFIRS